MPTFLLQLLLKVWPYLLTGILSATATGYIAHSINGAERARWETQEQQDLYKQGAKLEQQCADDKAVTTGVSHEYETKFSALSDKLANLKRMHTDNADARCVPLARPACGDHAAARPDRHAGPDGINADALRDYAGAAETLGLKLDACQDFIRKTWALKSE